MGVVTLSLVRRALGIKTGTKLPILMFLAWLGLGGKRRQLERLQRAIDVSLSDL